MFMTTIRWYTFELTHSYEFLGLLGFCMAIPHLVLSPFATSISDAFTRRKTVLYFQSVRIGLYPILAIIIWSGHINCWMLLVFATLESSAVAMQFPSKLSLLMDLVGAEKMVSAGGFSSVVANIGRIVGPTIGGFLIAWVGPAWVFILASVFSIPLIIILNTLETTQVRETYRGSILRQFIDGAKYVRSKPRPVLILIIISTTAILGYGAMTLLPGIAENIFGFGSEGYGLLESTIGAGALVAAILLATKAGFGIPVKIFSMTAVLCPIVGLLVAFSTTIGTTVFAFFALLLYGFSISGQNALGRSILPILVDRRYCGRVLGFFSVAMMGLKPFGNLLTGFMASVLSVPITLYVLYGLLLGAGGLIGMKLYHLVDSIGDCTPNNNDNDND
jgi:predicted MFS family arabinose efflux permease